jgi:quercetin 2,3-dioxygenase
MKKVLHTAGSRGHANHGWLNSFHTFSFAGYHDPSRVHFGLLRVLNDDVVAPGMGFGTHPHENMEIVSIPLSGALHHKDTTGRDEIIRSGDVQIMSAGSGISHSEMNASRNEEVNFLQLWIFPKLENITPRYEQKTFDKADRINKFQTVVSPLENDGAIFINQDAFLSLTDITTSNSLEYNMHSSNAGVYVFVLEGSVTIDGEKLSKRDGLGISDTVSFSIAADSDASLLLIEVPMLG